MNFHNGKRSPQETIQALNKERSNNIKLNTLAINFRLTKNQFKKMGIDDIFCLAVNDVFVLKAWLSSFTHSRDSES